MSGALMQLCVFGAENIAFDIQNNYVIDYITERFTNNVLNMGRNSDTKCPEYLEIELSEHLNIENFKTICHKICLEMRIGGQDILSIPLRFMMHLKDYECYDNKYYIKIPFEMFCDDIRIISLQYHEVEFKLTNTENNFASCNLISKGKYLDTQERIEMTQIHYENIIQCLNSDEIYSLESRNEFKYIIPFGSIHKGFFIETENSDEINNINILLNGLERLNYNRFLVRTKCIKINQHLLYLPLNYEKSYKDRTPNSFQGSLNLSRVHRTEININLDCQQSKICIYGLGSNILKIMSGMGRLQFTNNLFGHHFSEYNDTGIYHTIPEPVQIVRASIGHVQVNDTIVYKVIDNSKLSCCITYESIDVNARYMSCSECNNNYSESSIKSWFLQRPERKSCPMCRVIWKDFTVYINSEESRQILV
jgi:hypothetical protein